MLAFPVECTAIYSFPLKFYILGLRDMLSKIELKTYTQHKGKPINEYVAVYKHDL